MDLVLWADSPGYAEQAQAASVAEIDRLCSILSTYIPTSELSQLNNTSQPRVCSSETVELLTTYDAWRIRSNNIINPLLGQIIHARKSGLAQCHIDEALAEIGSSRLLIDPASRTIQRIGRARINIDALGKAFIIDRIATLLRVHPGISAGLLNIGGDIRAWGTPCVIAVPDPANPAENAPPAAYFTLHDAAIATSGITARGRHLLNPLTGETSSQILQATVVGPDAVTANAVATALCIAGPDAGVDLPHLAFAQGGQTIGGAGFERAGISGLAEQSAWPAGYQVVIPIHLKTPYGGRRAKRPYVAVWVEDSSGKAIRTITVWGSNQKYLRDLPNWWKIAQNDRQLLHSVTRPTRSPGQYTIAWDGKDDKGKLVSPGAYKVVMEVHREHGNHATTSVTLACESQPQTAKIKSTAETEEATITFGPTTR